MIWMFCLLSSLLKTETEARSPHPFSTCCLPGMPSRLDGVFCFGDNGADSKGQSQPRAWGGCFGSPLKMHGGGGGEEKHRAAAKAAESPHVTRRCDVLTARRVAARARIDWRALLSLALISTHPPPTFPHPNSTPPPTSLRATLLAYIWIVQSLVPPAPR